MIFRPLVPYLPHPMVTAVFVISFVFLYTNAPLLFAFPDTPWHIASGDLIRSLNHIPHTDPWSSTADGYTWYNLSWLWDCIISGIVDYFGLQGLHVFILFLHAVLLSLLSYHLLIHRKIKESGICATIFVCLMVLWPFVGARPQIVTLFMTLFFMMILHGSRVSDQYKKLLLLPLLIIIWANMHGGFLVAFVLLGCYFLEAYISNNFSWMKRLFFIGLVCAACTLINPYGWEIVIAVHRTLGNMIASYVAEWQPLTFGTKFSLNLIVGVFILASNFRDKEIPMADKILSFSWLLWSLLSIRNFAIFALVAAPYLAINISKIGNPRPFPDLSSLQLRAKFFYMSIVTVLFLALIPRTLLIGNNSIYDPEKVPLDAIEYIEQNYKETRFYNSYLLGGYLIYYASDWMKVFIDGRAGTAYPDQTLMDVISVLTQKPDWIKVFDKHSIDGIIVQPKHQFSRAFEQGNIQTFKQVFESPAANVYIRK